MLVAFLGTFFFPVLPRFPIPIPMGQIPILDKESDLDGKGMVHGCLKLEVGQGNIILYTND